MSTRTFKAYGGRITLSRISGERGWVWEAWRPATRRVVWGEYTIQGGSGWGVMPTRRRAWRAAIQVVR